MLKEKNRKSIQGQGQTTVSMMADFSSKTMMKGLKEKKGISEQFYIQQKYPLKIKMKLTFFK